MRTLILAAAMAMSVTVPVLAQPADSAPPPPQPALERADVDTWLDGLVPYAIKAGDIAGAVVTVVADGEVLTTRGYGYADIAAGREVDPDETLFRTGSISKLVTWTAVMQQVERGTLDLDTDVNAYLDFAIPPLDGEPVTLRHILTHTAGFEEQLKHIMSYEAENSLTYEEIVRNFVPARIFAPGTTPAYSNYATALAGYIVERVSGQVYDEYVQDNIFAPLGMDSATFSQNLSEAQIARLSKGYATATQDALPFELVGTSPAGSMTASAPDMAKFMLAHLDQGRLGQSRILEPATARLMHEQALAPIPALNGMALGFYESSLNGHRVISHGGDTMAFHSDLHLFIDDGVGLFISINSTGEDEAAYKLRALLFTQFADRYFSAEDTAAPVAIGEGNAHLLAGQWTTTRRAETSFIALSNMISQVTITPTEGGGLKAAGLPILGAPVQDWIEVEPLVWQARNSHERLAAVAEDGQVTRFSIDSVAPIMVFEPVPWQRASSWLLPALVASLAVLGLTGLQWPAAALVRRRYRASLDLSGAALAAYRGVRAASIVVVATMAGWFALLVAIFSDLTLLSTRSDGVLLALQVLTIGGTLALGASVATNAWHAFADRRSLASRIWAIVLILAGVVVVWVAFVFNLFKLGVSY